MNPDRPSGPWKAGLLLNGLTVALWVAAFPNLNIAEAAYLFAVPVLLWLAYCRPPWRVTLLAAQATGWAAWLILLIWLRHVTLTGTIILAGVIALLWTAWVATARAIILAPRAAPDQAGQPDRAPRIGLRGAIALAAAWVLLEWLRSWLFTGFPWLTLAASQWQRPAMLQILSITGAWGLSFVLIFFNIAFADTILHWTRRRPEQALTEERQPTARIGFSTRLTRPLLIAMGLVLLAASFMWPSGYFDAQRQPRLSVAPVQMDFPQKPVWNAGEKQELMRILEEQTRLAAKLQPDIILWPESATPWPAQGDRFFLEYLESLVAETGIPLLSGNMGRVRPGVWHNTVIHIDPRHGLAAPGYNKRKLVPFGEYVPFAQQYPWLERLVGEGTFIPGADARIISLDIAGRPVHVAPLICYEDIFPALSREFFTHGNPATLPELFFVATNNAWYGTEAGAYQHAAHSVLRAVETRRPFVRSGIAGWSGWIDEYGRIRHVMTRPGADIYFRGTERFTIDTGPRWRNRISPYMRYGDWFVAACACLAILCTYSPRKKT